MLTPGQIVKITHLRPASFYLYKSYLKYSPLLICPCVVKRDVLLEVIENFENDVVLLRKLHSDTLTMTFASDLEPVYERTD
jgi:hypothetical protein